MTDQQIAIVASILSAGRLCVGWDNPAGHLRRILAVETWDGEPCGVFLDNTRRSLRDVNPCRCGGRLAIRDGGRGEFRYSSQPASRS